jgi:hypothetical protein
MPQLITIAVIICILLGMLRLTATINGWRELVKQYKFTGRSDVNRRLVLRYGLKYASNPLATITFGLFLIVGANEAGVYIGHGLFRWVGYSPIWVPWTDVKVIEIAPRKQWLLLSFAKVPLVNVELPNYEVRDLFATRISNTE